MALPAAPNVVVVPARPDVAGGHLVSALGIDTSGTAALAPALARLHACYLGHRAANADDATAPLVLFAAPSELPTTRRLVDAYVRLCALAHTAPAGKPLPRDGTPVGELAAALDAGLCLGGRACTETAGACAEHSFNCKRCPIRGTRDHRLNTNVCVAHELLRCQACLGALHAGGSGRTRKTDDPCAHGRMRCDACLATLCPQCYARGAHHCASAAGASAAAAQQSV